MGNYYKVINCASYSAEDLEKILNDLAIEGWRVKLSVSSLLILEG